VPPASPVAFPQHQDLARKFFGEAVRHLGDARVLHRAKRYPGSIASSMKAAELGLKSVLIVDGSLGWWDRLQQTHKPLDEIRTHDVLKYHYQTLEQHNPALITAVAALEKLAPSRPDAKSFSLETQANAEYPFFYLQPSAVGGPPTAHLVGPGEFFTDLDSLDHYRTAYELLTTYRALYSQIAAWKHHLPRPL
jgi:hypothetical protein